MENTDLVADDASIVSTLLNTSTLLNVKKIEHEMLKHEQVDCHVIHRFGPGLYVREVTIPAGTFAIGHKQKTEHLNVLLKGRVTVLNDDGTTSELVAPMMFVGKPGAKIGYIHEDMVWQNIYATEETDVETLERMYIEKDEVCTNDSLTRFMLEVGGENEARLDYALMIEQGGRDPILWGGGVEQEPIPFPFGGYKVVVSASKIHGKGLFVTASIDAGEGIAPATVFGRQTPAGQYTNHSAEPNAELVEQSNGDFNLVAIKRLRGCTGGRLGDEVTIDYRRSIEIRSQLCQS